MAAIGGKGMFIWQVRHCEGGDAERIVARCLEADLTHVLIKVADGRSAYNGDLSGLVTRLRQAGVAPWAWQYTYGSHPEEEARFAARRFAELPFSGFVVDAESEYKGRGDAGTRYMDALRCELAEATVALSSFYLPDLHPTFPWQEFLCRCDLNMPQVYWYSRGPERALRQSLEQNARYGRPVLPTGAAYPGACTAAEIPVFLEAVRATPLAGASFWSWQHATAEMWRAIADFAWSTPRLVVAVQRGDDFAYHDLASRFQDDRFHVRPADLAPLVGLESTDTAWLPLRAVAADLGLNIEYATEHLADPQDARLYAFIYEPLPTGDPAPRVVILAPEEGAAVSGVVPVSGRVSNLSALPDSAAVVIDVHTGGEWTRKGRASWSESGAQDWVFAPGWDTSGTPAGPNAIRAVLCAGEDTDEIAAAQVEVTVGAPGLTLAQVADGAEGKRFLRESYSWKSGVGRRYLDRVAGLCRAYAAECLAEFYLCDGRPNKRHGQRVFQYANVAVVGDDAHEWAAALRRGVDSHLGTWVPRADAFPDRLRPGDMVFWMNGVNGYRGGHGHVAIVVHVDGGVRVSENSSSRGIGTHAISRTALATMAGVMRWHR
jgi:hypothetical protein